MSKEDIIQYMQLKSYRPMTVDELALNLQVCEPASFTQELKELEERGQIIQNRKGRYGLPGKMNLAVGRIQGHAKGFAFLICDDPNEPDVFIKGDDLGGAMHNDRVIVRLYKHLEDGRKREGEVIRVLTRANNQVVGTFKSSGYFDFVIPDENRLPMNILIPPDQKGEAMEGYKVVVEITAWPVPRHNPEGKIIEVLGHKDDPGTDILSIVRKYQLPEGFPAIVMDAAEKIPLQIKESEYIQRLDLRDLPMVTIDGEDAKDLDDAVSLEILPDGNYKLGVHIADVGYYVQEGSVLDEEALRRATSVYLVDRVIPMLPPRLSNGICSLNAGEDRLAMTCFMEIDDQGIVKKHEILQSVIRVKERMTYTNVRLILEEKTPELLERYAPLIEIFKKMEQLCLILKQKRLRRGAIDFNFPESKVKLDENGRPLEIIKRERNIAEQIIEEFMIAANETVATHYHFLEIPFLYRVHETPNWDDLINLNDFLKAFGYHLKINNKGEIGPRSFQVIVEKAAGKPEEKAVNMTMLQSMKHARYSHEALGHFGLSSKYYSHFTSPIRRYPDLAIHRVIREVGEKCIVSEKRSKKLQALMMEYAEQSSVQERVAEDAERESVDLKKVEYMKQFVGEVFDGHISGVTAFGFFVELPNTAEGLVHVSTLNDDYYRYIEKQLMLKGEHTHKVFRIGDQVKVVVVRVNTEERNIDFELVKEENKVKSAPVKRPENKAKIYDKSKNKTKEKASKPRGKPKRKINKNKGKQETKSI